MELCKDCGINQKYVMKTGKKLSYCLKCNNARSAEARKRYNSSEIGKAIIRDAGRKKRGFPPGHFDRLLVQQDYKCGICNKDIHESSHADHDHNTGNPRGILCPGCNTLLGRLESVGFDWVKSAQIYLSKY